MIRDEDVEYCIRVEMQTLYPEEYERIYGNLNNVDSDIDKNTPKICQEESSQ